MRLRSLVIGLLSASAVLAAAASGYWAWWAGQLERGIAQWRDEQRLRGTEIAYDGPAIEGFPLAHAAHFEDPAIRAPDGLSWRGPALSAQAALWDPWTVTVSFPGRHVVEGLSAGGLEAVTLDSRDAGGVLRLDASGRLEEADARLEGLEVLAEPLGRVSSALLRLSLVPVYDGTSGSLLGIGFAVEADALQLPAKLAGPMDTRAERIVAVGRLNGALPQGDPRLALAAWRDNGGALDLERIEVEWAPLGVSASGRLTLDDRLRPQGQLAARIAGLPALLDRLAAAGLMTAQQVVNVKLGVLAFSGEPDEAGRPVLSVPVILNGGLLSLGPFPLARLSPVL